MVLICILGYFIYGRKIYSLIYYQLASLAIGFYLDLKVSGFFSGDAINYTPKKYYFEQSFRKVMGSLAV
jgi:hypothetical protein